MAVRIETPRGSFVKRDLAGGRLRVRFVSPLPCPFDYGQIEGEPAPDGMPRDAVWLGTRVAAGASPEGVVAAIVRFRDGGAEDDKWVVTETGALAAHDRARLARFFRIYAWTKRLRLTRAHFGGIDPPAEH